jgi:hypothetical protein
MKKEKESTPPSEEYERFERLAKQTDQRSEKRDR